ncbi:MAG: zinc ribbon domain-containing protein [Acidobacteria bacterium CG_4_9_14_3_um_filter_49_7]|nr:MAG: zinc ribbon domain-containing protein [Acidobacteria bacterium CG_4_9_14_3_um_filter_49_7]
MECVRCGLIFEKFRPMPGTGRRPGRQPSVNNSNFFSRKNIWKLLFHINPDGGMPYMIGRGLILTIILFWGLRLIVAPIQSNTVNNSFLHLINLPFHEAGHVFFRPFGRLLTSMGGSLGQLLVPLICCLVLLIKTRDPFGGAVTFWWFGENFIDLAPYVNDARRLVMPLVGGNTGRTAPYGFHDWQYILTETGLLKYDHFLARTFWGIGSVIMFIAVVWGFTLLVRQYSILKARP